MPFAASGLSSAEQAASENEGEGLVPPMSSAMDSENDVKGVTRSCASETPSQNASGAHTVIMGIPVVCDEKMNWMHLPHNLWMLLLLWFCCAGVAKLKIYV